MKDDTLRPIKVLLVDDHRIMLWSMTRLIDSKGSGMEVGGTATTLSEAVALLSSGTRPDVILLDLDLGGESGVAAIATLRDRSDARILIFTGMQDQKLLDQAMLAGARGILLKAVPATMVLKAIAKVHEGEIWLDREAVGRLAEHMAQTNRATVLSPRLLLTTREWEIASAIVQNPGKAAKATAHELGISAHTLNNHLAAIYSKLGLAGRVELFAYMHKHGLGRH